MDEQRAEFEAWAKSKGAPKDGWWIRQIDDGGYSCHAVDMAWEAWQAARAQPAQAVPWLPIETAPKDCGFLGYQPLTDDMWISAPMYWAGSEFLLLQFHHGDTEHSMTPTHWMPLPPPPGIVGEKGVES